MSQQRRAREMRGLAYHVEYGGNYPAMHKSGLRLKALKPTAKELRRLDVMKVRKWAKEIEKERRWEFESGYVVVKLWRKLYRAYKKRGLSG